MVRPQVANGATAFSVEGSCEYIEEAVTVSRQKVVLQLVGLGVVLSTAHHKNVLLRNKE